MDIKLKNKKTFYFMLIFYQSYKYLKIKKNFIKFLNILVNLFFRLISPSSLNKESQRREYILNILLVSSIFLSLTAFIITFLFDFFVKTSRDGNSSLTILCTLFFYVICLIFSKKGKAYIVSLVWLGFYFVLITKAVYTWGPDMPVALLIYALIVVMSGILLSSKTAILVTITTIFILNILTILNKQNIIFFRQSWKNHPVSIVDIIIFSVIFIIIAVVSWLFNRESEKALERARISESELEKERNLLEIKVQERTSELRKLQLEETTQLYRFAELGKMASGFFHDFSNSVQLVSLNLQELNKQNISKLSETRELLERAQVGLNHMEEFISAAGKHINNQDICEEFILEEEINQVINILSYKARKAHVYLKFIPDKKTKIFNNPIKFHQLVSNIVSNAIDSYLEYTEKEKIVTISVYSSNNTVELKVTDNGKGISSFNLRHVFEPFFSTKKYNKSTGLGLSISKSIVTKELKGEIVINSKENKGTTVTINFPEKTI